MIFHEYSPRIIDTGSHPRIIIYENVNFRLMLFLKFSFLKDEESVEYFLDKGLPNPEFARTLLCWRHSGFSIDGST